MTSPPVPQTAPVSNGSISMELNLIQPYPLCLWDLLSNEEKQRRWELNLCHYCMSPRATIFKPVHWLCHISSSRNRSRWSKLSTSWTSQQKTMLGSDPESPPKHDSFQGLSISSLYFFESIEYLTQLQTLFPSLSLSESTFLTPGKDQDSHRLEGYSRSDEFRRKL